VTSARSSELLGRTVGLAWVGADLAHDGAQFDIRVGTYDVRATVRLAPFYDSEGRRLRA
jgi:glycine cleavage system aminomethyltransferase T